MRVSNHEATIWAYILRDAAQAPLLRMRGSGSRDLHAPERRFHFAEAVKERIGIEMMRLWYEHGGRAIAPTGVAFLRFQTGSHGYRTMVRGDEKAIGDFALESLDGEEGTARVRSTTPFDRTMERGVLIGGMQCAGDLVYVDVVNSPDPSSFDVRFHR